MRRIWNKVNDISCRRGIPDNVFKRLSFAGLSHPSVYKKQIFRVSMAPRYCPWLAF
jgi:hypothetical protein